MLGQRAPELQYRSVSDMARAATFSTANIAVDQVNMLRRIIALEKEVASLALAAGRRVEFG